MNKSEKIKVLEDGIRKYSPVVAEFFDREENIINYSRSLYEYQIDKTQEERQIRICREIENYIKRLFKIEDEINSPLIVNIVDHHAILNHPILLATNFFANAYRLVDSDNKKKKPIVVLTSSVVPPNNFFNKRGFQYRGKKIPLFSTKYMHQASCFVDKIDFDFIKRLKDIEHWNQFNKEEQNFLITIEKEINNLDFSVARDYNDQISIIDRFLWKRLFHQEIRENIPDLFYLTQEEIMVHIFSEILKGDNIVSEAIFNRDLREKVLKEFEEVTGCWDEKNQKGTYFFWYRDKNREAERMYLKDDFLVAQKSGFKVKLEKTELIKLIEEKIIIPNLFIIFGYLVFWCGIRPLVGHGSSNYLTKMKEAWLRSLKTENEEEYRRISNIDTKGLIGGAIVTFKRDQKGEIISQYAFDVISDSGLTSDYLNNLLNMKYKNLLRPALLEIYDSYVPVKERVNLELTTMDMMGDSFDWIK